MRKIFTLPVLLFLMVSAAWGQKPAQVLQWINTVKADKQDCYFEIPFEYRNNQIVIKVKIGQDIYDYIFDTGGYNDITDAIQAKNHFPVLTTQTVGSSNKIKRKVNLVTVDSLQIGELVFRDVTALQMNFDSAPTIQCTINGALIGASIIKNFAWQIDYPNRKIIVTNQVSKLPNLEGAIKVPVTFDSRLMPHIQATIEGNSEKLLFDMGSSTLLSLTEKTGEKYAMGKNTIAINGVNTEGGNGILQQPVYMIPVRTVAIGSSILFKNQPALFMPAASVSLIGNPIIKNFIVTLNFANNELYLTPIEGAPSRDGMETFGLALKYDAGKTRVSVLYDGLPAAKAGLALNDEVIAINGEKISCNSYCSCLPTFSSLLDAKNEITLTIKKEGIEKEVRLVKAK